MEKREVERNQNLLGNLPRILEVLWKRLDVFLAWGEGLVVCLAPKKLTESDEFLPVSPSILFLRKLV